MELLSNPGELLRRYGLTTLIVVAAVLVTIFLVYRASTAESRKWQQAWHPLQQATANADEEQLRAITATDSRAEALVRAWAHVKHGELLYNKRQKDQYVSDLSGRDDLLNLAIESYGQALNVGKEWPQVIGQATIGMGLCYENLDRPELAEKQYDSIIAKSEERFAGTIWLIQAKGRKAFLENAPDTKIVFK